MGIGLLPFEHLRNRRFTRHPVLMKSLFITAICYIALWSIIPPHFTETNDDFVMASFAYGYSGTHSAHLMYLNIILGLIIKSLMIIIPWLPWYAILHVLTIYISYSIIVYIFQKQLTTNSAMLPVGLITVFFGLEFISSMQFSKTAGIAIVAGTMLMLYAMDNSNRLQLATGVTMIFIGSLFRFPVFEALLPFLFWAALASFIRNSMHGFAGLVKEYGLAISIVMVLCIVGRLINIASYQLDEGWAYCYNNNSLRSELIDRGYPDYDKNAALYEELDITKNDLELYSSSAYGDPELYTLDVMTRLSDAKDEEEIDSLIIFERFTKMINGVLSYHYFPAFLIVFMWVLLVANSDRITLLLLIFESITFICIQIYFVFENRFLQSRIDIVLVLALTCFVLYFAPMRVQHSDKFEMFGRALLIAALVVLQSPNIIHMQSKYEDDVSRSAEILWERAADDKAHFYLYYSSWTNLPDKLYDAFELHEIGYRENISPLGSWRFATPVVQDKMHLYGIYNPYRDIINNEHVYFVCVGDIARDQVMGHIRDHYASDAEAVLVDCLNDNYNIYRIVSESYGSYSEEI